jgi:hypothetical protein
MDVSLWTPGLEYAIERFSISAYLDWFDDLDGTEGEKNWVWDPEASFPDNFLNYLEDLVSNPWRKTKYQLQLLILIRGNLTFITIIPYVIWNTLHLPSAIPLVERNLLS